MLFLGVPIARGHLFVFDVLDVLALRVVFVVHVVFVVVLVVPRRFWGGGIEGPPGAPPLFCSVVAWFLVAQFSFTPRVSAHIRCL